MMNRWVRFYFAVIGSQLIQFQIKGSKVEPMEPLPLSICSFTEVQEQEAGTPFVFDVRATNFETGESQIVMRLQCSAQWDFKHWIKALCDAKIAKMVTQAPKPREKASIKQFSGMDHRSARGFLMRRHKKIWNRRWFVLNGTTSLMFFESTNDVVPMGSIPLGCIISRELDDDRFGFQVKFKTKNNFRQIN